MDCGGDQNILIVQQRHELDNWQVFKGIFHCQLIFSSTRPVAVLWESLWLSCGLYVASPWSRLWLSAPQGFSVAILMQVTSNCCVGVFSVFSIHKHDPATFRLHHSPESLVWNKASVHYKPSMAGYENLMRGLMAILTQIRGGNVWIMNTALRHYCHHFRRQISWRDQSVQSLNSSFAIIMSWGTSLGW